MTDELDDLLQTLDSRKTATPVKATQPKSGLSDLDDLLSELDSREKKAETSPQPKSQPPVTNNTATTNKSSTSLNTSQQKSQSSAPPPQPVSNVVIPKSNESFLNNPDIATCISCGLKILDEALVANKNPWHARCLACSRCAKSLVGVKFIPGSEPNIVFCNTCGLRWLHESGKVKK